MALDIRIPDPCTQRWEDLEPSADGTRLCSRCHQHVTDFRRMSDDEVALAHALAGGRISGVYDEAQLRGDTPRRPSAPPRLVTLALGATLLSGTAAAQSAAPPGTPTVQTPPSPPRVPTADADAAQPSPAPADTFVIHGTVRDEEGRPVPDAYVTVFKEEKVIARTDSLGAYTLALPEHPRGPLRLQFIRLGLRPVVVDVPAAPEPQVDPVLTFEAIDTIGLVVLATPPRRSIIQRVLSIFR
jgi:hypothetical protein